MSIYSRDNINYQSMLDGMIRNRSEQARRDADNIRNKGQLLSSFIKDSSKAIGKGMDYYAAYSEDPNTKLAELQKELEEAEHLKEVEDKYNQQVAQRMAFDDYALRPKGVYDPTPAVFDDYQNSGFDGDAYSQYLKAVNNYRRGF